MSAKKLTAQAVENAEIPAKGRSETWDTFVRGLGLRVTDRGSKSWVVMYRVNGRQRRLTLGSYPALKLADGKGNLVRQVEKFRELGAQVKKPLPKSVLEKADSDET